MNPEKEFDICVVGTGRVGLTTAVFLADRGFNVIGIDTDPAPVEKIQDGIFPIDEVEMTPLFHRALSEGRLKATTDIGRLKEAETVIIAINILAEEKLQSRQVIKQIAGLLTPGQAVIIRTTVPLDMVDDVCAMLEKESGLVLEENLFLAFVPERFVEGAAFREVDVLPQLIGAAGENSYQKAYRIFSRINTKIIRLDPRTAIFAKLINNVYRNTLFAFGNEMALLGEKYGLDAFQAIKAANFEYSRCNVPLPGLVGGPCLPKDTRLLMGDLSGFPDLVNSGREVNDYIPRHIYDSILKVHQPARVCILGMTYKKNIRDFRGSQSIKLVDLFRKAGAAVSTHDPADPQTTLEAALAGADTVILAMNHSCYKNLPEQLTFKGLFYDCWGMFGAADFKDGVRYMGLGRGDLLRFSNALEIEKQDLDGGKLLFD